MCSRWDLTKNWIMMSGDSPPPNAHGDHLCEMEAVAIQPISSKMMSDKAIQMNPGDFINDTTDNCIGKPSDKAIQMNPADFINEPVVNCAEKPKRMLDGMEGHTEMAVSTFPTLKMRDDRRAAELEDEICNGDEISSLCPSDVKAKSDDSVLRSEEIETVTDQTDNPSTPKYSVNHPQEEDSCLINCLFYLDECCTCTIV